MFIAVIAIICAKVIFVLGFAAPRTISFSSNVVPTAHLQVWHRPICGFSSRSCGPPECQSRFQAVLADRRISDGGIAQIISACHPIPAVPFTLARELTSKNPGKFGFLRISSLIARIISPSVTQSDLIAHQMTLAPDHDAHALFWCFTSSPSL